mgnify:CR=1 FL=1
MRTWRAYDGIPHNPRRYAEPLSGVLLSYSGLRLKRPLGRISHDAPEVHVCVEFDATYFAPRVGDVLEGTVSRIGEDHIALLVLGVFNASVARKHRYRPLSPALAPAHSLQPAQAHRTSRRVSVADPRGTRRGSLRPDDTAVFVVRSVSQANGLMSMVGELMEVGTYRAMSTVVEQRAIRLPSQVRTPSGATEPPHTSAPEVPSAHAKPRQSAVEKDERRLRKERKAERAAARAAAAASAAVAAASSAPNASLGTDGGGGGKRKRGASLEGGDEDERRAEKKRRKAEKAARKAAKDAQ